MTSPQKLIAEISKAQSFTSTQWPYVPCFRQQKTFLRSRQWKKIILLSPLLVLLTGGCRFSGENSPQFDLGIFAGCVSLVLALAWLIAGIALVVALTVFFILHFFRRKS